MGNSAAHAFRNDTRNKISFDYLRNKLKIKNLEEENKLFENFPNVKKKLDDKNINLKNLRQHSAKLLGAGLIGGGVLLSTPSATLSLPEPHQIYSYPELSDAFANLKVKNQVLTDALKPVLPDVVRPLSRNEEKVVEYVVKDTTGVPVKATLEGEHLNTIYGLIGAEQHLKRYPGDNINDNSVDKYRASGMAPGLGAWGYFAHSKEELTPQLAANEKWYAVVQTLYLPDWGTRQPYLKNWYKYRKVMIINVDNGNAVVCDIADSGPAAWTGKSFGGSPEVMDYLGGMKYKKGKVIVLFVDDPENKIPLGPVDYAKLPALKDTLLSSL